MTGTLIAGILIAGMLITGALIAGTLTVGRLIAGMLNDGRAMEITGTVRSGSVNGAAKAADMTQREMRDLKMNIVVSGFDDSSVSSER